MIAENYKKMLQAKSVIRELAEFAARRGQEIGYESVYDYSLGNPSVPTPQAFNNILIELIQTMPSKELHGYSPSLGIPAVNESIASSLNRRFSMSYRAEHIFMTSAAAGAVAHALRCVTVPGDKVLAFAPFFPEYMPYVNLTGAQLHIVPADTASFQIDFSALEALLSEDVMAILINTPNNPSGVGYNDKTLAKLAEILTAKQAEYGHDIFLISDEPYREIVFGGKEAPYVSAYYDNSLSCYSYSKSLSLPGERIGYLAVNPACTDAHLIGAMCGQISRGTGHNCPSSLMQLAVARVPDLTCDMSVYETNMNLIYNELRSLDVEVVKPDGTFYIFPRVPGDLSAEDFCKRALAYDLILVPGTSFGCPNHFRMAYCIDTEKVERSLPVLRRMIKEINTLPTRASL